LGGDSVIIILSTAIYYITGTGVTAWQRS